MQSCYEYFNIENDNMERSKRQAQFINRLRWFAKTSNVAVILINHAADIVDKRRSSLNRGTIAALGPSWDFNIDENI